MTVNGILNMLDYGWIPQTWSIGVVVCGAGCCGQLVMLTSLSLFWLYVSSFLRLLSAAVFVDLLRTLPCCEPCHSHPEQKMSP
jgi:hypothetical protein